MPGSHLGTRQRTDGESATAAEAAKSGSLLQLARTAKQKVIEVQHAPSLFLAFVAPPDLGDEGWLALARSSGAADGAGVVAGCQALSLCPLDLRGQVGEHGAVAADLVSRGGREEASFGGDDDWRRPATFAGEASQLRERDRMEGPGRRGSERARGSPRRPRSSDAAFRVKVSAST